MTISARAFLPIHLSLWDVLGECLININFFFITTIFRNICEERVHQLNCHFPSRIQKTKMIVCFWWCKWTVIKVVVKINGCWFFINSHINDTFLETIVRVTEIKIILMINNAFDVETMNSAHETHIKVSAPLSIRRLLRWSQYSWNVSTPGFRNILHRAWTTASPASNSWRAFLNVAYLKATGSLIIHSGLWTIELNKQLPSPSELPRVKYRIRYWSW